MYEEINLEKFSLPLNDTINICEAGDTEISIDIRLEGNNFVRELDIGKIPETEKFVIDKILINEGKTFTANEPILILKSLVHGTGKISIKLNFNGKILFIYKKDNFNFNDLLLKVSKIDNDSKILKNVISEHPNLIDETIVGKEIDDFTNEWSIEFVKVLSKETKFLKLYEVNTNYSFAYIGLSLTNFNGYSYINFLSTIDEFSLSKGDEIILLFEDNCKFNIKFNESGNGSKGARFNSFPLDTEILELLLFKSLLKIKVISLRKKLYAICSFEHSIKWSSIELIQPQYSNPVIAQLTLKIMTYKFIQMNLNNNG